MFSESGGTGTRTGDRLPIIAIVGPTAVGKPPSAFCLRNASARRSSRWIHARFTGT